MSNYMVLNQFKTLRRRIVRPVDDSVLVEHEFDDIDEVFDDVEVEDVNVVNDDVNV